VLPFANVSGDAEQEYFADGMSEDLIASCGSNLFVIGPDCSPTRARASQRANRPGLA
jgi:adenylate cyclase